MAPDLSIQVICDRLTNDPSSWKPILQAVGSLAYPIGRVWIRHIDALARNAGWLTPNLKACLEKAEEQIAVYCDAMKGKEFVYRAEPKNYVMRSDY